MLAHHAHLRRRADRLKRVASHQPAPFSRSPLRAKARRGQLDVSHHSGSGRDVEQELKCDENSGDEGGEEDSSVGATLAEYRGGTSEAELRKVLEVSNHITILFAASSIVLGGVLLGEGMAFVEHFVALAVGPFVMVLFGVFLILDGLLGAYVSGSDQLTVLVFYEAVSICFACFLLLWAAFCFYQMSVIDARVEANWEELEEQYYDDAGQLAGAEEGEAEEVRRERMDETGAVFKVWFLVNGIVEVLLALLQMVNCLAAHGLFQVLRQIHAPLSQWHLLSRMEKVMYVWAICAALVHIFVDGTHAIFSMHITPKEWFFVAFEQVGQVDARYTNGDSSIAGMEFILAVFAGPGCLIFAWSIYTKQAHRHIIGLLVSSTQLYTQVGPMARPPMGLGLTRASLPLGFVLRHHDPRRVHDDPIPRGRDLHPGLRSLPLPPHRPAALHLLLLPPQGRP